MECRNDPSGKSFTERNPDIFQHLLKLFVRSVRANPVVNMANLIGLAAGLATCMMIMIFLHHEFRYDAFQPNAHRLVRINTFQQVGGGQAIRIPTASYPVAEGLAAEIPAVENFTRFVLSGARRPVYVRDKIFFEEHLVWAEASVFAVFHYPLRQGNPATALAARNSVVLAESTARKYFGDENPLGQNIRLGQDEVYQVTGVMVDIPQPSHLPSHPMLLSMKTRSIDGAEYWVGRSNIASYLLLREGAHLADVQRLADEIYLNHAREIMAAVNADCRITLQPLTEIHFDTTFDFTFDYQPAISYQKILVFSLLAVFILVIAAIGFINMTTARSGERARQVGICKAVGASRRWLIVRFLGESVITALVAMVVALVLVQLLLPTFSGFVSRELSFGLTRDLNLAGIFLLLALGVGLLAGIYPAFVLSSFAAGETMRGNVIPGTRRARLRSALIVLQFAISILLVICTLTVNHQLRYMSDTNPGFYRDQIVLFDTFPEMTLDDCRRLRQEALKHPGIEATTLSYYLPTMGQMEYTYRVPEAANTEMLMARQLAVDEHFIDTMGLKLLAGRDFRANLAEDINKSIIINETAARVLGWKEPVGRQLDANPSKGPENFQPVTIVGVVQDIHFESLHHDIQPMVLAPVSMRPARIAVRIQPGNTAGAIAFLRKLWTKNFPQFPFVYQFLNENFEKMYDNEIRLGRLFTFFTGLAIVISCIGLLALIVYATERRTREISIRKVLGASPSSLLYLLSRDYLRLVLAANLLAWPLALWALLRWLDDFAYRAPFPWWLYPLAGLIALLLALATASLITWKTCRLNPADALREE